MLNQDWFAPEWRAQGHTVVTAGIAHHLDLKLPYPLVSWQEVCAQVAGFSPELIIVHDNSSPLMVTGIETAPMPTVFYSVDTHHHVSYHKLLAGAFDLNFIAQRDFGGAYSEIGEPWAWLPLWASRFVEASVEKRMGAVFVGTLDRKLNPERVTFFEELQKRREITIERGEYWKIFPHAEVVINQTVKGDLNFRVFEGMMCGACLLTERSGNGFEQLFAPDQHLAVYTKNNVEEAAAKIDELLGNVSRTREIARAGREQILSGHLAQHRADLVMEQVSKLGGNKRVKHRANFGMGSNIAVLSLSMERVDPGLTREALRLALGLMERGAAAGEAATTDVMCHALLSALRFDRMVPGNVGMRVVEALKGQYKEQHVLTLGLVRHKLNSGDEPAAQALCQELGISDFQYVYQQAELVTQDLLARVKTE
jgi:hypothetical protein